LHTDPISSHRQITQLFASIQRGRLHGHHALIDGGEANSGALAYLRAHGVRQLDAIIATHPHSDHIGGLPAVLTTIPVSQVYATGQPHTTSAYEGFLNAIFAAKAKYTEVKRGDRIPLGNLTLEVLSPSRIRPTGDMNNNSLVLRLDYGSVGFLFEGDAQAEAESALLAAGLARPATVLKVGHHGSRSSSTPAFLAAVHPQIGVYSAGAGNSYGHPHPQTIANLKAVGTEIHGTDQEGSVVITTDGNTYQVTSSKAAGPRAPPEPVQPPAVVPTPAETPVVPGPELAPAALELEVISVTSPARPGGTAALVARTTAGAACSITVYYKSGRSKAAGLVPVTAGGDATCSWTWKVGTATTPGRWRIVVTAQANGQTKTIETSFEVAR